MRTKALFNRILWVVIALFLSLFCILESVRPIKANAEEITYTDVMTDLQKDENFNPSDYPAVSNDYSLQVIQIAESSDSELFIYVYQPSNDTIDLIATSIRFSTPILGTNSVFNDYSLTLLSAYGVFDKYKVEGFTVKTDNPRYYDIAAIHRAFNSNIDEEVSTNTEQTVDEVVCKVGSLWKALTENNRVIYSCQISEVIEVTAKVVGYIRYSNGFSLKADSCDSYLVAFTTDRQVEQLQAASVGYKWRTYRDYCTSEGVGIEAGVWEPGKADLKAEDEVIQDGGWFGKKYKWRRIEKVSDFLQNSENLNLTKGAQSDLEALAKTENTSWVLRFFESDYDEKEVANLSYHDYRSIQVTNVTIIQLTFLTNGVPYNLGVVDNKQTGSSKPLGTADTVLDDFMKKMEDWFSEVFSEVFSWMITIGLVAVLVVVIVTLCPWLISFVGKLLSVAFKWLFSLIALPFKLIGKLFKKQ